MSFKTNGQENSNVHNFLPDLHNNPSTFYKSLGLYLEVFCMHFNSCMKSEDPLSKSIPKFISKKIFRLLLLREFDINRQFVPNFLQDGSNFGHQQEKIRQGWSLLSTLHCLLLSGKLVEKGSKTFKKPNVEQLAIRYNNYYSTSCSPKPIPKLPLLNFHEFDLCLKKKVITKKQTRLVKHVLVGPQISENPDI